MSTASRTHRTVRIIGILVVIAVITALMWFWKPWEPAQAEEENASEAVTVPVEKGTLTSQLRLNATLGYGDPVALAPSAGMITALPAPGQVIEVGSAVYEANGRPIILLQGTRPFWRDLSSEASNGADILQLEQNLARLGFFTKEPDERFDWWTTDAVNRWQKSLGLRVTGIVTMTDVVIVNAPSLRISRVTAELGQSDASPATYTATTLRAVTKLSAAQARELSAGTPVSVVLPDGTELENTIAAVDPGGQPTGEKDQTTPPTALIEFPAQEQVASIGEASIRLIVQNQAESTETLIVPATALIATAESAYAVEVKTTEGVRRVPVQIGLAADARVQILASGSTVEGAPSGIKELAEGDAVVISR